MSFTTETAPQRVGKHTESIKEKEQRKRDLARLMQTWKCKVGFEFHVQMATKHKMFSTSVCSSLD
jgi:hypothetical protein